MPFLISELISPLLTFNSNAQLSVLLKRSLSGPSHQKFLPPKCVAPIFKSQACCPPLVINKYTSIYQKFLFECHWGPWGKRRQILFLSCAERCWARRPSPPLTYQSWFAPTGSSAACTAAHSDWSCAISIYLFIILRTHRSIWKCTWGTGQIESSAFIFHTIWSYSCYNRLWEFFFSLSPFPPPHFFL